jgi:hypothetical protein
MKSSTSNAHITVIPTLEAMAAVYRLPTDGGPSSSRFRKYVSIMLDDHVPAAGYNPMTSKPVAQTIEALLAIDAESLVADVAREHAHLLALRGDFVFFITVGAPGLWTNRVTTEVEHRLSPTNWSGGPGSILLWTGEEVSEEIVARETVAQLVRTAWMSIHGSPPVTTAEAAGQEGVAYAVTGTPGRRSGAVADAIGIVGPDDALATKAALLYGDDLAATMGFLPLGLATNEGYDHVIAVAADALTTTAPGDLLRAAWTPLDG